jgi:hypothetical protein
MVEEKEVLVSKDKNETYSFTWMPYDNSNEEEVSIYKEMIKV